MDKTGWQPQVSSTSEFTVAQSDGPAIEAFWIGVPQWMGGVNNGFEAFGGSLAKGVDFFGSNITLNQYVPVEIKFDIDSANWSNVQVFRRDNGYNSAGVGTFPGSAWDISDSTNPRRLNLCIVELDDGSDPIPPPNFKWDPDTSQYGKYEYLFVMNSSYDGTGTTYAGYNILQDDPDVLYAWWPRVAAGHTFFETPTASLLIKTFLKLNVHAFENDALIDWVVPGTSPSYFKLFWGNSSPPTNLLTQPSGASRGFQHHNLTQGLNFYYQLKAYNSSNVEINTSTIVLGSTAEWATQMGIVGYWDGRGDSYGACWGYTDSATGREYGLICIRSGVPLPGVAIIDIDTIPQMEVGFIPGANTGADVKEVRVWDRYAVVISEYAATQIVDLIDPHHPHVVSSIAGGRHCCMVDSHFVYLSGGSGGGGIGGLAIWSIANPASPQLLGQYNPYYYHDYCIYHDTLAAFAIYGEGIDILDVTNKSNPHVIGHFSYPGNGPHNGAFTKDGNYLFVGDEIGTSGNWTREFDVSDLNNISLVANLIVNPSAIAHNCYVRGDYLVISHYTEGVRVWNVANPLSPFEVAHFDTYPISGGGYNGCWHNYPYFKSGRIVASDMKYGLYVLTTPYLPPDPGCCQGPRGDMNGDGHANTDILDLTFTVDHIFRGGPQVSCDKEGDINGDSSVCNIIDLTFIVDLIFRGGPQPPNCP